MATQSKPQYGVKVVTLDREETIESINYVANSATYLPFPQGTFPNERFVRMVSLDVSFRLTMPAANMPASINDDAPYSLIDLITFSGFHNPRAKDETFYKIRGATAYYLQQLYGGFAPRTDIKVNGVAAAALSLNANATNDVRFTIDIPLVPLQIGSQEQIGYLLDAPNYDNLKLEIKWSDPFSVFSGGDMVNNPVVVGGYGGVGAAKATVNGVFVMGGTDRFKGFVPARVMRIQQNEKTSGSIVDGALAARLFDIPRGFAIRSVIGVTGVRDTTTSAGNFAFATRSDDILTKIRVNQGLDNPIRKFDNFYQIQDAIRRAYLSSPVKGYCLIDFAKNQRLFEALPTRSLIGGPEGDVALYVSADVAAGANQAMSWVVEEIRYSPQWPQVG